MRANLPKIEVSARLSFGYAGSDRYAALRIEDRASSLEIIEIRFDAEQLMNFLGGGGAQAAADWMPHPERVGRTMETGQFSLDSFATPREEAQESAEAWRIQNGWDTVEMYRNNHRWVITGRRWVVLTEES